MAKRTALRHGGIEPVQHVRGDVGIGVLVDDDARSGVRDKDVADARPGAHFVKGVMNPGSDLDQLLS